MNRMVFSCHLLLSFFHDPFCRGDRGMVVRFFQSTTSFIDVLSVQASFVLFQAAIRDKSPSDILRGCPSYQQVQKNTNERLPH